MGGFYHEDDSDSSLEITLSSNMDRGLAYAESCFETFRVINGKIFSWPDHMARLQQGLAEFGMLLSEKEVDALHMSCLDAAAQCGSDAMLRLTLSGGDASWGLLADKRLPRAFIQAMAYHRNTDPLCLRLLEWPFPPKQRMAKFTADYSDTLRALNGQADLNVLFGHDGYLLSAATANVLIYRQNHWYTPACGPGVLPGIVRAYLLNAGLLKEAVCPVSCLQDCEAVALTNSGYFLRPVAAVSGTKTDERHFDITHPAMKPLLEALAAESGVIIHD